MATFFMKGAAGGAAVNPYSPAGQVGSVGVDDDTGAVDQCKANCYDRYQGLLANASVDNAYASDMLQTCLDDCRGGGGREQKPPEGGGCPGGYLAKMAGGRQLVPCKAGYFPQNINGTNWCCPATEEEIPCADGYTINRDAQCPQGYTEKINSMGQKWCCPGGDEPPIEGDCKCSGGKKVADVGFSMGKGRGGAIWEDPHKILPPRYIRSGDWEGHMVWDPETQKYYYTHELQDYYQSGGEMPTGVDSTCPKGWTREGDCCCPGDGGGGDEEGRLGEFKWPDELMGLWDLLAGRGKQILTTEPGFNQATMDQMFGKGFENIRNLGGPARQQQEAQLQSEGLLGTGASRALGRESAWEAERQVGDVIRDLFVMNEEKKKRDLLDYAGAGRDIIGAGQRLYGEGEAINAGRRNESLASIALWLQYLQSLLGSWSQ